jgi:LCP family protein required for cell wall assembly
MFTERKQSNRETQSRSPDRLTRILVVVAVLLAVIVVVIAADLWADRETDAGARASQTAVAALPTRVSVAPTPIPTPLTPAPCVPPQDWGVHTVQAGDTLYSLAQRYGTNVDSLSRANCVEDNIIIIGQELRVPGPPAASTASALATRATEYKPAENVQAEFPDRYINIILLGSDKREDQGTWRTDTMIVVSVDTERSVVRLLSIPRDLWVNIPGHGFNRINTADLWGELTEAGKGPEVVKETVYQNLGIPIHYFVRVDFDGFIKIIDAIGGLDIDVECPLTDIELEPGIRHMDGELALLYARSRITTNDFDRSRRQRKLLMALWEQGLSRDIIPRLPQLWVAMADTIETDLPLEQVINLARLGLQLKPNQIFSQSIGPWQVENWTTPEGAAVLLPDHDAIQELLSAFYGPIDWEFLDRINQTQVEVLNGTWRDDLAGLASTTLNWAGFQVPDLGMADRQDYAATQVIVYEADPAIAELVAQQLDLLPSALQYQPDPSSPVDIRVILGADYDPCSAN